MRDAAELSAAAHAALAAEFPEAEAIGFHGQTLAHDPAGRGTHQAGRWRGAGAGRWAGAWSGTFAPRTCAGAARARRWHRSFIMALARWAVAQGHLPDAPLVFLNMGGVGNLTWCDPRVTLPQDGCVAFDTGPANAPVNDLMRARLRVSHDDGGRLAASGTPDRSRAATVPEQPLFPRAARRSRWTAMPSPTWRARSRRLGMRMPRPRWSTRRRRRWPTGCAGCPILLPKFWSAGAGGTTRR